MRIHRNTHRTLARACRPQHTRTVSVQARQDQHKRTYTSITSSIWGSPFCSTVYEPGRNSSSVLQEKSALSEGENTSILGRVMKQLQSINGPPSSWISSLDHSTVARQRLRYQTPGIGFGVVELDQGRQFSACETTLARVVYVGEHLLDRHFKQTMPFFALPPVHHVPMRLY